ncbi:MAG: hypothetical protein RRA92_06300 [Gemmatimonadota bacterium]|nr:hypothetical protein [Gemmatimonadota bacterium]
MLHVRPGYLPRTSLGVVLALGHLVGCHSASPESEGQLLVEQRGDTVVATNPASPVPPIDTAGVEVIFQSDDLEEPVGLVRVGSRLVIGDRTRIHFLDSGGDYLFSSGRSGEGPGEFRSIVAIGVRADSVLILDSRLMRLSVLDSMGVYARSVRLRPRLPFVSPRRGAWRLRSLNDAVLYEVEELVQADRPTRVALVLQQLAMDSVELIQAWEDILWTNAQGIMIPAELFRPRAIVSVGSDGRYAFGDGLEYCVTLAQVRSSRITRICREWERAPVVDEVRAPNLSRFGDPRALDDLNRKALQVTFEHQSIGDHWLAYDQVILDEIGRLWVRRIGADQAGTHPHLWYYFPEARPSYYGWDVFEPDGRIGRTVMFPGHFQPRLIQEAEALGIAELDSGELTIARAVW